MVRFFQMKLLGSGALLLLNNMTAWTTFSSAYRGLIAHRGRSFLTVLGIVIGIVAIVLVVALGTGVQRLILDEVEGLGASLIVIRPGREPTGPTDFADTLLADSVGDREIAALRRSENVSGLERIEPAVLVPGSVSYRDSVSHPIIFGWTARAMADFYDVYPEQGSFFSEDDVHQRAKVAVIGSQVADDLFGTASPVGETIRVGNTAIRVVGVLPQRGQVSFLNIDTLVLLPYTTAQRDILGISHYHEVIGQSAPGADVDRVADDIRATLRELHGIVDPSKDDFYVSTQKDLLASISTVTNALTVFLSAIASVALVVGGVGIMNIMLVSVTERTREIGLRIALGARPGDILRQFLFESVILTFSGGVVGTVVAVGLSAVAALVIRQQFGLHWQWDIPYFAVVLGIGVSAAVGLVFGLYPARRAARMDPIDALRYE